MNKKMLILLVLVIITIAVGVVGFCIGKQTNNLSAVINDEISLETINKTHIASSMSADFYDTFYPYEPVVQAPHEQVFSGIIPHHLVAGSYIATFFEALTNQKPEVVVLFGPNHPQTGRNNFVTSLYNWRTPYGTISASQSIIQKLVDAKLAVVDEKIIDTEHTIGADVPFIKKTWPEASIVPIIIKDRATIAEVQALASKLKEILPEKSLILASVDFSHYLPESVANFHDELSENVLEVGDSGRAAQMEIDSPPSVRLLLEYNKLIGAQNFHTVFHTNSAGIAGHPEWTETTSHIGGYYTAGKSVAKPLITVQFFGDMMLDRNVAKNMGKEGLEYILQKLHGQENRFFEGVNMFVTNLEGPFAPARIKTSKSIAFRFDPALASQLKKYNFSAFDLANNHSYDMGAANVVFTRQTLAKNGFGYFGDELNEGPSFTWVTTTPKGESIAFLGIHNTYHEPDLQKVEKALVDATQKARYVIVNVHWGEEYKRLSNQKQQTLAHWLVDHGATAIIGHHPHVVQEIEIYKDAPIFYSLGNFVFDQYFSKETQEGLSVGLTLENDGVKSIYLFPFFGVKSQVQLMAGARRDGFLEWMEKNSRLGNTKLESGILNLE